MNNIKKNLLIFIILFIVTNIIFIPWLTGHMATDSYNIYNKGYQAYNRDNSMIDGRFIVAIGTSIMDALQIPIKTYSIIILEIALIISCLTVMILLKTIEKWKRQKNLWSEIILLVACYYTIFNFMYIENLYFIECAGMAFSILFFILSAKILVNKDKMWTVKSFLLLALGLMGYQGTISIFFITVLVFSMCKGNKAKTIIKDFMQGLAICLLGIVLSQLEINIVEQILQIKQGRGINFSIIIHNLLFILDNFGTVIEKSGYYLPDYLYIIILSITEILMIFKVIQQNKEKQDKRNANIIIEQIIIIIIGIMVSFIPSIINLSGFWSGRIRYSIGALIGLLWIHLWIKTNFAETKNILNILLTVILIAYGVMNSANYISVMLENNKVNNLDKETVIKMKQEVKQYEIENQI